MNYQEFLEYIKENLPMYMFNREMELQKMQKDFHAFDAEKDVAQEKEEEPDEHSYEAYIHTIIKNNGVVLDGVTLLKKGEKSGPNVYLNSYYEQYQIGKPLQNILEEIILCYEKAKAETNIEIVDIGDFQQIKDKVILRLVHYEKNQEQLKEVPHKRFLDLAITFRYLAGKDAMGIASSLISNREFESWGIGLDALYEIALFNTMWAFPWQMDSLVKVVSECFGDCLPKHLQKEFLQDMQGIEQMENGVTMYVLTNDVGINGATSLLYDNVIKNFAKVQDCNIFILPSSIHEVMLVPENTETEPEFLQSLVKDANKSAVGLIDLLSDHIYYYDKELDDIRIYEV